MSFHSLERAVLAGAKLTLKNPRLRMKDILEWSTGAVKAENNDEVVVHVPDPGVNICVHKENDKREVAA